MDMHSLCSSDSSFFASSLVSNDTFEITRRGRQDRLNEGRLEAPFPSRYSARDLSFPASHSSSSISNQCSSSSPVYPGRGKVRFGSAKVINEGASECISEEEMQTRWWSQADLDDIKKSAKEMSLRLRKVAKERDCYVELAHKKTSLMLTNSFQDLVKMTPSSPDQDLLHWCVRSDGRRGLERFACRDYGNVRKDDVLLTRGAVFEEQDRQRKLGIYVPESLSKISKSKSRRSRTFSLFMGEADAQACSRNITRSRSKRVKVSHSASSSSKHQKQRHVPGEVRREFPVDAPLLTSSA